MHKRFAGRVALVAGGAGGIGRAICMRLVEQGAIVICADRSERRGAPVVAELVSIGGNARFHYLDAGSVESWARAIDSIRGIEGRLDILVTAFFSGRAGSIDDMPLEQWQECFRATATGVFLGLQESLGLMADGGAIINIGSVAARKSSPDNIGYAAAKSAVLSLSRNAAFQAARRNIRINVVSPGAIQTPALDATLKALATRSSSNETPAGVAAPLGRIGQPDDIAHAVCFLASEEAGYITGTELIVDGGLSAAR
jgi:NAD(P)-dependent dehydrogenase (short-subunit alcohol dehydrogenase family)